MLGLCFILFLAMASLLVFLWMGTYFFQGYIYTQPSPGLFWQAPVAALVLTFGFTIWTFAIALGERNSPTQRPIDTLLRFNPREELLERPAPRIWAIKLDRRKKDDVLKDGDKTLYVSKRDNPNEFHYEDTSSQPRRWQPQDILAIEVEQKDGANMRFDYVQGDPERGTYGHFVSAEGWVIELDKYQAPTGIPVRFLYGRLFWNLIFNFAHLLGWFLVLWVVLRFQWSHALGLGFVLWLVFTIIILPMMLGYAGEVALSRRTAMTRIEIPLAA